LRRERLGRGRTEERDLRKRKFVLPPGIPRSAAKLYRRGFLIRLAIVFVFANNLTTAIQRE